MLASMRNTASSFFMKLLMMLLVLSFVVWGVGDVLRSGNTGHLAKVGAETVSYPEFARGVDRTQRMAEAMGIHDLPRQALQNQVLQRLIEEKLVHQKLKDAGFEVNQQLLAQRVAATPMFKNEQGKFDPVIFHAALAQRGMNENSFLAEMSTDARAQLFTASLGLGDLTPPPALVKLAASAQNERRDAVLITIPASAVKADATDGAALTAYYEANKELLYLQPEKRTLEYVTFGQKDLDALTAKQPATSDAADARAKAVEDVTNAIEDALAAGDSMGSAVAKAGLHADSHVLKDVTADQYAIGKDALLASVAKQGFALQEGETSNIATSANGQYFIVGVKAVTQAAPKPFDTVKDDVMKRTAQRAQNKALRAKADDLATALKGQKDWQSVAAKFDATGRVVKDITRSGNTIDPALTEAVFEREVGEVAGPLIQNGTAQVALVTDARFSGAPAKPDAKTLAAMAKDLQQEIIGGYYGSLTDKYPVRVNQAMLQQIQAQDGGE